MAAAEEEADTKWITENTKDKFSATDDFVELEEWFNKFGEEPILQASQVDVLLKDFGHENASFATCVFMNIVSSPDLQVIHKDKAIRNVAALGLQDVNQLKNLTKHLCDSMLNQDRTQRNWDLFRALMDRAANQVGEEDGSIVFSAETPNLILFSIIFAAPTNRHVFPLGFDFAQFICQLTKESGTKFVISKEDLSDITNYLWFGREYASKEAMQNQVILNFEAYFAEQVKKEQRQEKQKEGENDNIDISDEDI